MALHQAVHGHPDWTAKQQPVVKRWHLSVVSYAGLGHGPAIVHVMTYLHLDTGQVAGDWAE